MKYLIAFLLGLFVFLLYWVSEEIKKIDQAEIRSERDE